MGRIASPQNSGVSQAGPGFPSTQRLRATRPRGGGLPCAHVRGGGRPPAGRRRCGAGTGRPPDPIPRADGVSPAIRVR